MRLCFLFKGLIEHKKSECVRVDSCIRTSTISIVPVSISLLATIVAISRVLPGVCHNYDTHFLSSDPPF